MVLAALRLAILLPVLLAASWPGAASAQGEHVSVRLDGRILFRVGPSGEDTGGARAERIEQRLRALLDNPAAITPAQVEPVAGGQQRSVLVAEFRSSR